MPTFEESVRQIFPTASFLDEKERKTAWGKQGTGIERTHTMLVNGLRTHSNPVLARLGRNLWDVIHYRHVLLAMTDAVPTIHFVLVAKAGKPLAALMVPPGWGDDFTEDPLHCTGGVVFTGSRAVDYYNDRFGVDSEQTLNARAFSYEAELLKAFPGPFNDYQQSVLKRYPGGFSKSLDYDYRGVSPGVS